LASESVKRASEEPEYEDDKDDIPDAMAAQGKEALLAMDAKTERSSHSASLRVLRGQLVVSVEWTYISRLDSAINAPDDDLVAITTRFLRAIGKLGRLMA
jgi:hypothetical protein